MIYKTDLKPLNTCLLPRKSEWLEQQDCVVKIEGMILGSKPASFDVSLNWIIFQLCQLR